MDWENRTPLPSQTAYVFAGGTLGEHDLACIRPRGIRAWRMAADEELSSLVDGSLHGRISACLAALRQGTGPVELRNGTP
ncbi:hypothetical protein [Streptomyces sp. NPDC001205]